MNDYPWLSDGNIHFDIGTRKRGNAILVVSYNVGYKLKKTRMEEAT